MNSTWTALLWKEWREHAGKLLALCVIAVVAPIGVSIWVPELVIQNLMTVLTILIPLSAMFIGMGIAASEQSRGTICFLQALPTSMAPPATAKLLLAVVTVSAPVVVGLISCLAFHRLVVGGSFDYQPFGFHNAVWGITNWPLATLTAGVLAAASILIWMAAAGVNLSDEIRAGAVGMLVIVGAWAIAAFLLVQTSAPGKTEPNPFWFRLVSATLPGGAAIPDPGPLPEFDPAVSPAVATRPGLMQSPSLGAIYWPFVLAAALSNGAMAAWFLARFGRVSAGRRQLIETAPAAAKLAWLAPPRRSPLVAILWKQMRETLPLALMGAVVILLVAYALATINRRPDLSAADVAAGSSAMLVVVWMIVGSFVAIVAGVGVFMDDLRPGLHAFWRSRPINVDQWFVAKVASSGVTTIVVLALPALAAAAYVAAVGDRNNEFHHVARLLAIGPLIQFGLYAAAIAAITLVRQPIYAAILTLGAAALTGAAADWMDSRLHLPNSAILAWIAIASLVAVLAAWIAVRKDWGWKG